MCLAGRIFKVIADSSLSSREGGERVSKHHKYHFTTTQVEVDAGIFTVLSCSDGSDATVHRVPKFGMAFLTESNLTVERLLWLWANHVPVGFVRMAMEPAQLRRSNIGL